MEGQETFTERRVQPAQGINPMLHSQQASTTTGFYANPPSQSHFVEDDVPVGRDPNVSSIVHKREVGFWEFMTSSEFYPNNILIWAVTAGVIFFYSLGCGIIYFILSKLGVWDLVEMQRIGLSKIYGGLVFVGLSIILGILYAFAYYLTTDLRFSIVNY